MPKHDISTITLPQINTPYLQHPFTSQMRILLRPLNDQAGRTRGTVTLADVASRDLVVLAALSQLWRPI